MTMSRVVLPTPNLFLPPGGVSFLTQIPLSDLFRPHWSVTSAGLRRQDERLYRRVQEAIVVHLYHVDISQESFH